MKFHAEKVNGSSAGLFLIKDVVDAVGEGDVDSLISIIREYSRICGKETRQKMVDAITNSSNDFDKHEIEEYSEGIDYSDTQIRGISYVYLWFDCRGELFYIGKGKYRRAEDKIGRSDEFLQRAEGGYYRVVAYNLDEIYALDLETILILEATFAGRKLVNINGSDGISAVQYCTVDRDALLWYWDHWGAIAKFSELTGIEVLYNAEDKCVYDAIDSRWYWYANYDHPKTNDPKILEEQRKVEEKKRKAREYQARRRKMKPFTKQEDNND